MVDIINSLMLYGLASRHFISYHLVIREIEDELLHNTSLLHRAVRFKNRKILSSVSLKTNTPWALKNSGFSSSHPQRIFINSRLSVRVWPFINQMFWDQSTSIMSFCPGYCNTAPVILDITSINCLRFHIHY